ncbi:MAG: hypothetical protein NVS4B11_28030 [Ktedonobacteraceae bacterium]
MATTEGAINLEEIPSQKKTPSLGGAGFDWIVTLLGSVLVSGIYLDAWAHAHGRVDNTFFTPWHAVLYSGFAITAGVLVVHLFGNRLKGYPWRKAIAPGYGLSVLGVFIFATGGVLDMLWHIFFGIEVSIEILLSPTHLMLALGVVLIVTGPLRAAWLRFSVLKGSGWRTLLPAVLSVTLILSIFMLFTQYAHPLVNIWAARDASTPTNRPSTLYMMNADGSNQTRLTSDSTNHWNPAWSHDGRRIAFGSGNEGDGQIYIMNADGSDQTRLTNDRSDDWAPSWSPDDRRIIFTTKHDGNNTLSVMNADGSNQIRLTSTSAMKGSWSPDGTKIAFVSQRDGNQQVYVMNADGSGQTRLTNTSADDGDPVWSPDGTKIAFVSQRDGKGEIYVMNADGSQQTRLTSTDAWSWAPVWSPDGSKIAFVTDRDGNSEIYVMNADGNHQVNLSNNPGAENGNGGLAWSADGRKIIYAVQAHPTVDPFFNQALGLSSILLQTALLMSLVLLLVRRWILPFGSLTLMFTMSGALISVINDQYLLILVALGAGVIADGLLWWLKPSETQPVAFRLFAFLVPPVFYGLYFLALFLNKGVAWSIHLWMGSIVIAGVVGLLLSYLLIPPLTATEQK